MADNEVHARLATEWLRHQHTGCGFCRCGHQPDHGLTNLEAQATHVAEVLLSLPGIATLDTEKTLRQLRYNAHDLGEFGTFIRLEYAAEILATANAAEEIA